MERKLQCCLTEGSSFRTTDFRFTKRIMELNSDESEAILTYLNRHIAENHSFQVRYKWQVNDVAIWDNR
jgi:alpha-ketoglutarate-dependent taurine dioxygenase